MKKMKFTVGIIALLSIVAISCKNKPTPPQPCLPAFVHTGYSDSLAAINHNISLQDAKAYIKRFRQYKKDVMTGKIKDSLSFLTPRYETFNRDAFHSLINHDSIVGVRIFKGINNNYQVVDVMFGVKPNGQINPNVLKEMGQNPPIVSPVSTASDTSVVNNPNINESVDEIELQFP